MYRWVKMFSRIVLAPFYGIEIRGPNRLPPKGAFILLPKHQRWQDIPLIALASERPLYFMAKHELFTSRLSSWFLKSLGGIPLNRQQPIKSREGIRAMMAFLEQGEGVVVFPEGTYYADRIGPGKSGMLRLIVSRAPFPLIPAGLRYRKTGWKTRVCISFGDPIRPQKGVSPDDLLDRVMAEIARLSGFSQG
jgi:1-acyl-sn-glycerol-3-phosphate acyltransferase